MHFWQFLWDTLDNIVNLGRSNTIVRKIFEFHFVKKSHRFKTMMHGIFYFSCVQLTGNSLPPHFHNRIFCVYPVDSAAIQDFIQLPDVNMFVRIKRIFKIPKID